MEWFNMVKDYYISGFYTKDQVKVFVVKNKITATQYEEITGDPYTV